MNTADNPKIDKAISRLLTSHDDLEGALESLDLSAEDAIRLAWEHGVVDLSDYEDEDFSNEEEIDSDGW